MTGNIYFTIDLVITDEEWEYHSKKMGKASIKLQAHRDGLEGFDPGSIVKSALQVALAEFDASPVEEKEEEADA